MGDVQGRGRSRSPCAMTGTWEVMAEDRKLFSGSSKFCFAGKGLIYKRKLWEPNIRHFVFAMMGRETVLANRIMENVLKLGNKERLQTLEGSWQRYGGECIPNGARCGLDGGEIQTGAPGRSLECPPSSTWTTRLQLVFILELITVAISRGESPGKWCPSGDCIFVKSYSTSY